MKAQEEYGEWIRAWLPDTPLPCSRVVDKLVVGELAEHYLTHARGYYRKPDGRPTGEADNIELALKVPKSLYGGTPAATFRPSMLRACRDTMIADGLSRTTINERINRIRRAFRWAVSREMIPGTVIYELQSVEPLKRGRTNAKESKDITPVERKRVDAALPYLSPTVQAMIELQWCTGMRSTELTIMRPCDIDMSGNTWLYRPTQHKTEHHGINREIWLGPRAVNIAKPFIGLKADAYLFSPEQAVAQKQAQRRAMRQTPVQPSQQHRRKHSGSRRHQARRPGKPCPDRWYHGNQAAGHPRRIRSQNSHS